MNTNKQDREFEVIRIFEYGRFKVTVSQVKMTDAEREIENNRIRKQFIMAQS